MIRNNYGEMTYEEAEEQVETQGISLFACLEAGKVFEEVEDFEESYLKLVTLILQTLCDEERYNKAFIVIKSIYILFEIDEPEYISELDLKEDIRNNFVREFIADWIDIYEQSET